MHESETDKATSESLNSVTISSTYHLHIIKVATPNHINIITLFVDIGKLLHMYFLFYVLLYSITIHSPISEQQKISASKANALPTEIYNMLLFSHTLVTIATPSPSISTVLLPAVMKKLSPAL